MGMDGAGVRGAIAAALEHTAELERPELSWLRPKLEGAAAGIDEASRASRAVTTPEIEAKRKAAGALDETFDIDHRFLVGAHELAELHYAAEGDAASRKAVMAGRRSLYPEGRDITQKTWNAEGDETLLYAQRLERPEVKTALALVVVVVPSVPARIASALATGKALKAAVRELAILEAGRGETPQMFAARTRGMQVLGLLRSTVDEVYPASNPGHAVVREKLVGAYLALLAAAADGPQSTGAPAPSPSPSGGAGGETPTP